MTDYVFGIDSTLCWVMFSLCVLWNLIQFWLKTSITWAKVNLHCALHPIMVNKLLYTVDQFEACIHAPMQFIKTNQKWVFYRSSRLSPREQTALQNFDSFIQTLYPTPKSTFSSTVKNLRALSAYFLRENATFRLEFYLRNDTKRKENNTLCV